MGKKSGRHSSNAGEAADVVAAKATTFVLKVPTHCQCTGCADKIHAAVKDLTLRCEGIVSLDQSVLATKGELAVVATADPEKLQGRLHKATSKTVDLIFPKPAAPTTDKATVGDGKHDVTVVQALLLAALQQQQTVHALQGGRYGQAYAYPWVVQQKVPPPEPYFADYPVASSWGGYAAYPHDDGLCGAYGGGGAWLRY